jgi:hypothetical protein
MHPLVARSAAPTAATANGSWITLTPGTSDFLYFDSVPSEVLVTNISGNDVYVKYGSAAISTPVSGIWWDLVIPDGESRWLKPHIGYGLYIDAAAAALVYSGASKNFALVGFF